MSEMLRPISLITVHVTYLPFVLQVLPPRHWDRTGTIREVRPNRQYIVQLHSSNRLTLRNRAHQESCASTPAPAYLPQAALPIVTWSHSRPQLSHTITWLPWPQNPIPQPRNPLSPGPMLQVNQTGTPWHELVPDPISDQAISSDLHPATPRSDPSTPLS